MKNVNLIFALVLLWWACNSPKGQPAAEEKTSQNFHLTVKIKGFPNGKVKLLGFIGDQSFLLDSAMTDATGKAQFKHDTLLPSGMYFLVFPDETFAQMLIDKSQHITMEFDKADVVNTMQTQGSLDMELLYKNLRFEAGLTRKFDELKEQMDKLDKASDEYKKLEEEQNKLLEERKAHIRWFADNYPNAFFTRFKIAGQNPELKKPLRPDGSVDEELQVYYYRNEFWDNVDFTDERLLRTPVYFNKLKKFMKELTPQIPDSLIKYADIISEKSKANKELFKFTVNWIALQYKNSKIMGLEKVYVHMVDKYWTKDQAWWSNDEEINGLRKEISYMKPSLIGEIGQDIRAKNEKGEYISMYEVIKTPITVLYIFSYECDNCKKETPHFVEVMKEWKAKGVADAFTLSVDNDEKLWKEYITQSGLIQFHNVFDFNRESQYHRKYHIDVTPEIYVMNKEHRIIASNIDSKQLPEIFERELGSSVKR
ncbi:MAG: hypothetical protein KatS3mg031_0604 [Chitinophagales bacterium]|nr:MAG: hypothetical protein KatS3mg031_0604 [Chitinophagales bacterium]